jgi:hypothetical protein
MPGTWPGLPGSCGGTSWEGKPMTQSVTATLIDDIDQSTASETVSFGVDGAAYEIDLSAKHASALRSVVGRYISVARRIRTAPSRAPQHHQPGTRTKTDTQESPRIRSAAAKDERGRAPRAARDDLAATESAAPVEADARGDDHGLTGSEKQELRNIAAAAEPLRSIVAGRLRTKGLVDRDTAGNWWLTDAGRRELMSA